MTQNSDSDAGAEIATDVNAGGQAAKISFSALSIVAAVAFCHSTV